MLSLQTASCLVADLDQVQHQPSPNQVQVHLLQVQIQILSVQVLVQDQVKQNRL